MLNVQCSIEGTSAFLMNRYKMAISTETGGVKKNARTGEPDWFSEWKDKMYLDQDGRIAVPGRLIEKSMEKSAVQFKVSGKRGKTYKEIVGAMVFTSPSIITVAEASGRRWKQNRRNFSIKDLFTSPTAIRPGSRRAACFILTLRQLL